MIGSNITRRTNFVLRNPFSSLGLFSVTTTCGTIRRSKPKIGRNDICPKHHVKYKKCCGGNKK